MSRFERLNNQLGWEDESHQDNQKRLQDARRKARSSFDPLVNEVKDVFEDFVATILRPRMSGVSVIRRVLEVPHAGLEKHMQNSIYEYELNVVPDENGIDPYLRDEVVNDPEQAMFFPSWQPDIALQVGVRLSHPWNYEEKRYEEDKFVPQVFVRIWGVISEEDLEAVISGRIGISHGDSHSRYYTTLSLKDINSTELVEEGLSECLEIVAPYVLDHKKLS